MAEILLTRHAKSYANKRDPAFGNVESPLDGKGIGQAVGLRAVFMRSHDIDPIMHDRPVLASDYKRSQETALKAGFRTIHTNSVINEAEFDRSLLGGHQIIAKHQQERWIPTEVEERASRFVELVRAGQLEYQIYFTHGLFIAAVLNQLDTEYTDRGEASPYTFNDERGFIPLLATITSVEV